MRNCPSFGMGAAVCVQAQLCILLTTQKPSSLPWGLKRRLCRELSFPSLSLFLAGMGGTSCSCPAAMRSGACGSVRCWGWVGGFTGYRIAEKSSCRLVYLRVPKQLVSPCRVFQQCVSGAEKRASACWGETSARGSSVRAAWKPAKLEMPAAE